LIFITVGSHHQGFERLLKKIDELARDKVISDVFVLTGYSDYQPEYCPYTQFVGFNDFQDLIKKSSIVITHAGSGSILNALLHNKPTIAVPRLKKFGEHTNDHQLQLIKILEKEGKIIAVYDIGDLENAIGKAATFKPKMPNRESKIIELIEEYLTETGLIPEKKKL
jgi:UDP-N-acetylglucosamine transferase subunit ALG13